MDIWYKTLGWLPAFQGNIMLTKWSNSLWLISISFCGLTESSWFSDSLSTTDFWKKPGLTALDSSLLLKQLRNWSQRRSLEHPDTLSIDKVQLLLQTHSRAADGWMPIILKCLNTEACFQDTKFMNGKCKPVELDLSRPSLNSSKWTPTNFI